MNYFIDFEASNYIFEIISIGCIAEDGRVFSSLVRPNSVDKITKYITKLTGITREAAKSADPLEVVAKDFYNWIKDDPNPVFYCYGDSDKMFLDRAYDRHKRDKVCRYCIKLMLSTLHDFSKDVQKHYGLDAPVRLLSVYRHFFSNEAEQKHDALEDARMLKSVFYQLKSAPKTPNPFPNYVFSPEKRPKTLILETKTGEIFTFFSLSKTVAFLIENGYTFDLSKDVKARIKDCIGNDDLAYGFKVREVIPSDTEKGEAT